MKDMYEQKLPAVLNTASGIFRKDSYEKYFPQSDYAV